MKVRFGSICEPFCDLQADNLNLARTITDWIREDRAVAEPPKLSTAVRQAGDRHQYSVLDKEVERLEGGPGAVALLGLRSPISLFSGIEGSDTFVFVISRTSVRSPVCKIELAHAVAHNKRIVPVVAGQTDVSAIVTTGSFARSRPLGPQTAWDIGPNGLHDRLVELRPRIPSAAA